MRRVNNELRGIDAQAELFQKRILARFDKEADANVAKMWHGLLKDLTQVKGGEQGGGRERKVGAGGEWGEKGGADGGGRSGGGRSRSRSPRSGPSTLREMEAIELNQGWWGGRGDDRGRGGGGGSTTPPPATEASTWAARCMALTEGREVLARMEAMFQGLMGR